MTGRQHKIKIPFKPKFQEMILLFSLPGGGEWLIVIVILALIIGIRYFSDLQSAFDSVSIENRKMPSGQVWLLLIPLFGIVWHFVVVSKLADSIKAEADARGITLEEPRPAYNIGLAMCILNCFFLIPGLKFITSIAGIICWILYWIKINSYKKILRANEYNSM